MIVEDVRVTNLVRLDASDPDRPTIQRVEKPQVSFKVKLRSHGLFYGLLFRLLSPLGNSLAHKALDKALKGVGPSLAKAQGFPGPVPGAGAAAYTDSGAATPFETVANNVAAKAVRDNLPFGTVLMAEMDTPQTNSWLDAYGPGGTGNSGQAVRWHDYGDSAIWTGHFLGSQALRYHETGDPDALAAVRKALTGLGDLLDVYGGTGLLARYAAPISSHVGQYITSRPGGYRQATLHGQTWVAEDKDNNISRDQHCGAFFGFSLTYDLVADPTIKAEAGRRLLQMLDYLIAHDWWVDEDRHAFDASANSDMATFYRWSADQRMNYLLMGNLIAPHRYDGELQKVSRLAPFSWLSAWIGTSTLNGYYKFNLSHVTYYNYFRHETDAGRWQDVARGFRIMRRYVGHHRNPHFDLIACTVDPSLQGTLFPGSRESLRRFVTRNHRFVAPPVVDLSGVQWITVTMPVQSGSSITNQQVQIPAEPLDVPLQNYETHFLWQRSPFNHATPNQGNPRWEKPGTDLLLPYWMGRHEGAF